MTLYIFQSAKLPQLYGFTIDPAGANLPVEGGPWEKSGNALPLGSALESTSSSISKEIVRHGFALLSGYPSVVHPRDKMDDAQ